MQLSVATDMRRKIMLSAKHVETAYEQPFYGDDADIDKEFFLEPVWLAGLRHGGITGLSKYVLYLFAKGLSAAAISAKLKYSQHQFKPLLNKMLNACKA